jgi:hypothetical protein
VPIFVLYDATFVLWLSFDWDAGLVDIASSADLFAFSTSLNAHVTGDADLNPGELRETIEMLIPGIQKQIVLHDQGRNPYIVGRNRHALRSELQINPGIMMYGGLIRK